MLDALLADEKIPEEYLGQTQVYIFSALTKQLRIFFHGVLIIKEPYMKCRLSYAMIVKEEELLHFIGRTTSALIVVHTIQGFFKLG